MNTAFIVIGHLTNPFDLKGSFSVHFSAEDFSGNGSSSKATSRGFNLTVDAGSAKASAIHFFLVRLADGLRVEGFADCPAGRRNLVSAEAQFSTPDRDDRVGQLISLLHWDGMHGILTAHFTAPRNWEVYAAREEVALRSGRG